MMNDLDKRLALCFSNVFPELNDDEIRRASTASIAAWDSVAHVTLLSSVSEEFGQTFELEDFEELISYALIRDRLENPAPHA